MKLFVVLATVLAAASANPQYLVNNLGLLGGYHGGAIAYSAQPLVHQQIVSPAVIGTVATKTQYHAQDELGQASYGYAHAGQAHAAVRDAAGNVRGSYAYINPNGKEVRVEYTAGHGGFQVASNDLPVGPVAGPVAAPLIAPVAPQETPEVAQARAAHAVAHQEALARSGRKKRGIVTSAVVPSTLGYSSVIGHPYSTLGYSSVIGSPISTLGYSNVVGNQISTLGYSNVLGNQINTLGYSSVIGHPVNTLGYSNVISHNNVAVASPVAYSAVAAQPLREATLTKVVNTPGHAVSYRVD